LTSRQKLKLVFLLCIWFTQPVFTQDLCDRTGISNGWMLSKTNSEVDRVTAAAAASNALYFRSDFAWSDVQYEGSDTWNWSNVDRVVNSALAQDLELIAILDYFPPWANAQSDTSFWSQFVYEAGLRYIPKGVTIWEMWNEPNITNFWDQPDVKDYVEKILIPGSNAIRKAASDLGTSVTVISAGLAPAATDGTNISQIDFFKGIYENGGKDYFDAAGQHPYCWPLDPSIENPFNWFLKTEELRQVMIEQGDLDKKIWGTEMGWPTHLGNNGVSKNQQAQFLSSAFSIWNAWDWTGPLIWYAYNDAGEDATYSEDNFGLTDYDFNPKPALDSFLVVTANCGVLSNTNISESNTEQIRLYPNPSSDKLFLYTHVKSTTIEIYTAQGLLLNRYENIARTTGLDISSYRAGLYFAVFTVEGKRVQSIKFFKADK